MTADFTNVNAGGLTDQGTYTPDKLFDRNTKTRKRTIKSGGGVLARGTLLGKITKGAVTSATKAGGNTGTGTFVLDGSTPLLANAIVGVYALRCITAVTNGGVFRVTDPRLRVLGDFTITGGAGGTVTIADHFKGVLTDATTDFVVGDGFDITIAAGSGKYLMALAAAVDGSDEPDAILLAPVDATSADVDEAVAIAGTFGTQGVIFGAGLTAASAEAALRAKGIFLENVIG